MHAQLDLHRAALLRQVESAIAELQPSLAKSATGPQIEISGSFILSGSQGPFDHYDIRILVPNAFPWDEPKVFEVGGRIKRLPEMHINPVGDCCITVWEEWLVLAPDTSFRGFLSGPIHDYFLNQWWFEKTGIWRFGERSHGAKGIVEAYAEVLQITPKAADVLCHLRLLSKEWPKGHWLCPCGSGRLLRHCHQSKLAELHLLVPPKMAERMYNRLKSALISKRSPDGAQCNPGLRLRCG